MTPKTIEYIYEYKCDVCDDGMMIYLDNGDETKDTTFEHECNNCHYKQFFDQIYPRLQTELEDSND